MATGQDVLCKATPSALDMALEIFGAGTIVTDAAFIGRSRSAAIWNGGGREAPGAPPWNRGVRLSAVRATADLHGSGAPDRAADSTVADAAILEVDFIPTGNVMSMQVQLLSDGFPEIAGSNFSDIFTIWMNGAPVDSPVFSIMRGGELGRNTDPTLLQDNANDGSDTRTRGLSLALSVVMPVKAGVENTLRIGILDVTESRHDSHILIPEKSAQAVLITQDAAISDAEDRTTAPNGRAPHGSGGDMEITHVNGVVILPNGSVTLSSGHVVALSPGGDVLIAPPARHSDQIAPAAVDFSPAVEDSGITDTAFVVVTALPCLARETMRRTVDGDFPVEALSQGDLIASPAMGRAG